MSNSDNKGLKCERCQIENAIIVCQSCQPFHYFCHRCDSIVHSMRVKSSHIRQNIINPLNNPSNYTAIDDNNYSTAKFGELNLPSSSKRYFRTLTPKKQRIFIDNKLNEIESCIISFDRNKNKPRKIYENNLHNTINKIINF